MESRSRSGSSGKKVCILLTKKHLTRKKKPLGTFFHSTFGIWDDCSHALSCSAKSHCFGTLPSCYGPSFESRVFGYFTATGITTLWPFLGYLIIVHVFTTIANNKKSVHLHVEHSITWRINIGWRKSIPMNFPGIFRYARLADAVRLLDKRYSRDRLISKKRPNICIFLAMQSYKMYYRL